MRTAKPALIRKANEDCKARGAEWVDISDMLWPNPEVCPKASPYRFIPLRLSSSICFAFMG
jgi:hypothetical protein